MTVDPAAAEDAMFASDRAVFTDSEVVEIAGWNDGPMPDPWRHAVPVPGQTTTRVDAVADSDN